MKLLKVVTLCSRIITVTKQKPRKQHLLYSLWFYSSRFIIKCWVLYDDCLRIYFKTSHDSTWDLTLNSSATTTNVERKGSQWIWTLCWKYWLPSKNTFHCRCFPRHMFTWEWDAGVSASVCLTVPPCLCFHYSIRKFFKELNNNFALTLSAILSVFVTHLPFDKIYCVSCIGSLDLSYICNSFTHSITTAK